MVAVFGTTAADVLHVEFGVPYIGSTILLAVLLAVVFWTYSRTEPTLSIHSITTARRELFYWAAVLATFAMGTALGDLAAYTFNLGFLSAGILFADWTGTSRHAGGIGIGDGTIAGILVLLIVAGVAYLTVTRPDQTDADEQSPLRAAVIDEPA